ncbi:MAG TPA: hypothetical protein VIW22_04265, partial [Nitrososphaerales archaeon]
MHLRVAASNRIVVVIVLVIGLAAAAALILSGALGGTPGNTLSQTTGTQSTPAGPQTNVQLSGVVSASGRGTMATLITFAGPRNYSSQIAGGHYQLTLPGPATYRVSVRWTGNFTWQKGTTDLGSFILQSNGTSTTQDFNAATPNSKVGVSGSIVTSGIGTTPQEILFSTAGVNYSSSVTNGQYSLSVPNLATFAT